MESSEQKTEVKSSSDKLKDNGEAFDGNYWSPLLLSIVKLCIYKPSKHAHMSLIWAILCVAAQMGLIWVPHKNSIKKKNIYIFIKLIFLFIMYN